MLLFLVPSWQVCRLFHDEILGVNAHRVWKDVALLLPRYSSPRAVVAATKWMGKYLQNMRPRCIGE
jgi:hypothetical protein